MQPNDLKLSNAVRQVLAELGEFESRSVGDIEPFEKRCMDLCMQLGRALMQQALERLGPTEEFVEEGVCWKPVVAGCAEIMTTFGLLRVSRPRFRSCRNGPTRAIVEERAGLVADLWTKPAAKVAAIAAAEMPFERAESFFAELGTLRPSKSSMLRLVGKLCDSWEPNRIEHERVVREATPIPENATSMAISLDGVMISMTDSEKETIQEEARARGVPAKGPAGFREASVGVISFYDAAGERLATRRYGRMPEADKATTKTWLRNELNHIREMRPEIVTLAIADGAPNNWSFLESLKADHEVVDFFHTAEHLARHVSKANGASTLDTQSKLRNMRAALLTVPGAAAAIFADMQRLREDAGTAAPSTLKTEGKRQPTYFERHHDRMDYVGLRSQKLPIGSGVTESTCKLTVCDRMRRTGMRWGPRGGQGVLTLRSALVSGQFDSVWKRMAA